MCGLPQLCLSLMLCSYTCFNETLMICHAARLLWAADPSPLRGCIDTIQCITKHAGKERRWDIVKAHASVGVVLYHSGHDGFILVRQFRPAVYAARLREAAAEGRPAPPKDVGEWG